MKTLYTALILSIVFLASCVDDKKETLTKDSVLGEWKVTSTLRNGKSTKTMNNGIFYITEDKFTTNVPGFQQFGAYKFDGKKFEFSNESYNDILVDDYNEEEKTMKFVTDISKFKFEFFLKKKD